MRESESDRAGLIDLCKSINSRRNIKSMVEIGTYKGDSARIFHEMFDTSMIYCIDPWVSGYDDNDVASKSDMRQIEQEFDYKTAILPRIIKLKGTSCDIKGLYDLQSIELAYIDGCHRYLSVCSDLRFWHKRVTLAIAGHDYVVHWPEVILAVDEIIGKPDEIFKDGSWLKWV